MPTNDRFDVRMTAEELAQQYLKHIDLWCIKRKAKRKQSIQGAPSARAYDVLQAQAVMSCAKEDLPTKEYLALEMLVEHYRTSSRVGKKGARVLPPTAWSMHYDKCVLCDSTKRRHFRGGKCTGCWRATQELSSRIKALMPQASTKQQSRKHDRQ